MDFQKILTSTFYLAKLLILINHKPSLETHELAKKNWLDRYNRLLDTKKTDKPKDRKDKSMYKFSLSGCLFVCLFVCLGVWVFVCLYPITSKWLNRSGPNFV